MKFLSAGVFLGWSLGSNDAANVFGTAVSSRMVKYVTAVILTSIFVIVGALLEGTSGIKTLGGLASQTLMTAFFASLSGAITVTVMTTLKLPVSTSQAVVGGILGVGIYKHNVNFSSLSKVVACWIGTPIGAMFIAIILYIVISAIINRMHLSFIKLDFIIRTGLILGGIYGAYALGANNVANVTGVFYNVFTPVWGEHTAFYLALIGSLSIALGVITYSKNVMFTVGKKLVPLDGFSALIAILGEAVTVHIYAIIGVPVSTSQAIIGAVLGIGIVKGMRTINKKTLFNIVIGWVSTPVIALIMSYLFCVIFKVAV